MLLYYKIRGGLFGSKCVTAPLNKVCHNYTWNLVHHRWVQGLHVLMVFQQVVIVISGGRFSVTRFHGSLTNTSCSQAPPNLRGTWNQPAFQIGAHLDRGPCACSEVSWFGKLSTYFDMSREVLELYSSPWRVFFIRL